MFLSRSISAARGASDDFWYQPIAGGYGGAVTSDSALRLSTVYKCVRVRAETIGMLPLQVYRRTADGRGKEQDDSHPLAELLHDQPNPWQTAMQFRSMMQAHLDLRGNAYAQIVYSGAGRVEMLVPLHPDCMRVEPLPSGLPRYRYRPPGGGAEQILVFGEVLHVAGLSVDGYQGLNPIELERSAITSALAVREYGSKYFQNSARPPTWIEMPGKFATPDDRRTWVDAYSAAYGGTNSGKSPVLEQGMKLHEIAVNNADAQFIELRGMQDIDIAGLFRMPPHKIGILDRATWGNIEHQQLDFMTDCIMPSAVAWEQALLRDLDFGEGAFAEFKLQALLRGDTASRYAAYGKGIQDGWLTRNEARGFENLNPLDGLDVPLEPLNMAPAGSRGADQARGNSPSGERQALILSAAAERVARKELALWRKAGPVGAEHARWVSEVLAVPENAATGRAEALAGIFAAADPAISDAEFVSARVAELVRLGD